MCVNFLATRFRTSSPSATTPKNTAPYSPERISTSIGAFQTLLLCKVLKIRSSQPFAGSGMRSPVAMRRSFRRSSGLLRRLPQRRRREYRSLDRLSRNDAVRIGDQRAKNQQCQHEQYHFEHHNDMPSENKYHVKSLNSSYLADFCAAPQSHCHFLDFWTG